MVRTVHRRVERARHGVPPEEMGGTNIEETCSCPQHRKLYLFEANTGLLNSWNETFPTTLQRADPRPTQGQPDETKLIRWPLRLWFIQLYIPTIPRMQKWLSWIKMDFLIKRGRTLVSRCCPLSNIDPSNVPEVKSCIDHALDLLETVHLRGSMWHSGTPKCWCTDTSSMTKQRWGWCRVQLVT